MPNYTITMPIRTMLGVISHCCLSPITLPHCPFTVLPSCITMNHCGIAMSYCHIIMFNFLIMMVPNPTSTDHCHTTMLLCLITSVLCLITEVLYPITVFLCHSILVSCPIAVILFPIMLYNNFHCRNTKAHYNALLTLDNVTVPSHWSLPPTL